MSVFTARTDLLEPLEFKWGKSRGRLVAANDILSDLAVLLGTHAAFCQAARQSSRAADDILQAQLHLRHAKELLASLISNAAGVEAETATGGRS